MREIDIRKQKRKERFDRNFKRVSNKSLEQLKELDHKVDSMDFFFNRLESLFVKQEMWDISSKHIIGTFCAMVPEEIISACGAQPIRLCGGNYTAQLAGDENAPRDSCPVVKAVVGSFDMKLLPIYEQCELAIVPTSCDGKKKMAEVLANYTPTLPLHIPAVKDEESFEDLTPIFYGLIPEIEKITGEKLTAKKLKQAIEINQAINEEAYKLVSFKKMKPSVVYGSHVLSVMNTYQYSTREEFLNQLIRLNKELEEKVKRKEFISEKAPRILMTGSPIIFPNLKLPIILEELGAVIAADETCAGDRMLADPVYVSDETVEGMVRSLAVKYVLPCSCPTFAYNEERMYRLKQMVKDYQIDGIIYNVLRGCLPYDFEVRNVEKLSESLGVPVVRIETDYNTEDVEQLKIRLEAFVEMLKMK